MIQVYIDAEFDAVRYQKRFEQAVISFGAVACRQKQMLDTFYTLVRPRYFRHLIPVVKKMTHLKDKEILAAEPLEVVTEHFLSWLQRFGELADIQLYSCGPDDRRTLMKNCAIHHIDGALFDRIQDLQKEISATVKFQNKIISPSLSLDDMKLIYDIQGAVDHNALNDAKDLMYIHQRYLDGNAQNAQRILDIVNRKEAKQQEVRRKQNERLRTMMIQQFQKYPKEFVKIPLLPEVIEQFQLWEDRETRTHMHWKRKKFIQGEMCYPYDELQLWMKIDLQDEMPSVSLRFLHRQKDVVKKYPLHYRNATMVEAILKRVLA